MALVLHNLTDKEAVVFRFDVDKIIKELYNSKKIALRPNLDKKYTNVVEVATLIELLYGLGISIICKPNNEFDVDLVIGASDVVSVAKQHAKSNLPNLKSQNSSSGR